MHISWRTSWSRGWLVAAGALLIVVALLGHRYVPNSVGNAGSLLETFLPWIGLAIPVLLLAALARKALPGILVAGLAAAVWLTTFAALLVPGKGGGPHDLRVVSHNVDAANPDPAQTARDLLAADADVVALQEVSELARASLAAVLDEHYPYRAGQGTVALWSRHPLGTSGAVDIGLGWTRAMRTEVRPPQGPVAVYVAHLASVRMGANGFSAEQRNETVAELGEAIAAEPLPRVILLGDLNGTAYDRSLAPITYDLTSAQAVAGYGFGFSWPARFPLARIDHVLVRGVTVTDAWVLPGTGSDHRPVAADLRL